MAWAYRQIRDLWNFHQAEPRQMPCGSRFTCPAGSCPLDAEAEETALFLSLLSQVEVVVDIGANAGWYTLLARAAGKQTIAVEPLHSNLRYLYRNLLENGWDDVEVYPVALSARPGVALLYGGGTGASLVAGWAESSPWNRTPAAVTTLDIRVASRFTGKRLLIKIDVEGGEYNLLEGGRSVLSVSPPPIWIVEICLTEHHPGGVNPVYEQTFEAFFSAGYAAQTASFSKPKQVTAEDVRRWVELRSLDHGTHNFLFSHTRADAGQEW